MTENSELGERFSIEGFPTIMFFQNGKSEEYTGGRVAYDIVNWLRNRVGLETGYDIDNEEDDGVIVLTDSNYDS